VPLKEARERGAEVIIYSDVSILSRIYKKRTVNLLFQILLRRIAKGGPYVPKANLPSILLNTLSVIAAHHGTPEAEAPDFLIEPLRGEIKPLRFKKVEESYNLGRTATLRVIDNIARRIRDTGRMS
jgi:predicted acylesterase/phospholipase RssA